MQHCQDSTLGIVHPIGSTNVCAVIREMTYCWESTLGPSTVDILLYKEVHCTRYLHRQGQRRFACNWKTLRNDFIEQYYRAPTQSLAYQQALLLYRYVCESNQGVLDYANTRLGLGRLRTSMCNLSFKTFEVCTILLKVLCHETASNQGIRPHESLFLNPYSSAKPFKSNE